jgi:hypothetical protein
MSNPSFADAPTDSPDAYRLAAIYRLLNESAATGSQQHVVNTFTEAIAIGHDVEAWAYIRELSGRFRLAVSLPGSDRQGQPALLESDEATGYIDGRDSTGIRAFSFGLGGTALKAYYLAATGWLLVARIDEESAPVEAGLALYVEALDRALRDAVEIEVSRLTWSILQALLAGGSVAKVSENALEGVASATASRASLVVRGKSALPLLAVGNAEPLLATPAMSAWSDMLTAPLSLLSPFSGTVGLWRADGPPFTGSEQRLLQTAVATLSPWLKGVVGALPVRSDRRRQPRSFEEWIDRQLPQRVGQVSLLLLSLGEPSAPAEWPDAGVRTIRGHLRATDLAGRAAPGEVAVLMLDTPLDGARAVATRLRELALATVDARPLRIGLASANAVGGPQPSSLLAMARADATPADQSS